MRDDKKKEGSAEVVAVMFMISMMVMFLVWYSASNRIVFYLAPFFAGIGQIWGVLPEGERRAMEIVNVAAEFRRDSGRVTFSEWMYFTNICLRPLMFVFTGLLLFYLIATLGRVKGQVRRRFSKRTEEYLEGMSMVFTGIAPILHIRQDLAKHKDKAWRRQTFPEEILLHEKVDGKPLIADGKLVMERLDAYFIGNKGVNKETGLVSSRMLGNQVVDLTKDAGRPVCFPQRFSPEGKVIYALLCSYAVGDKDNYAVARDQLNNSCRGAKSGRANLTVANWLFDKYKDNPLGRKLFAVHHWEYTYLYALFIEAKKMGKVTHAEFLWLKPMNRIMFYCLNTVGRRTPHTESAGAFSQFAFERACSKAGRLPLVRNGDGGLIPSIFIKPASEGLALEWTRLQDCIDDNEEWWKDDAVWTRMNSALRMASIVPAEAPVDTEFDKSMRSDQAAADKKERERLNAAASDVYGMS